MRPKTNGTSGESRKEESRPTEDAVRTDFGKPKEAQQRTQEVCFLRFGKGRTSGRARINQLPIKPRLWSSMQYPKACPNVFVFPDALPSAAYEEQKEQRPNTFFERDNGLPTWRELPSANKDLLEDYFN